MRKLVWMVMLGVVLLGCGQARSDAVIEAPTDTAAAIIVDDPTGDQPTATRTLHPTIRWITATPSPIPAATLPAGTTPAVVAPPTESPPPPQPTATPAAPVISQGVPGACPTPTGWQGHTVLPGQFLSTLAACVGVSMDELRAANCLASADFIIAGEKLTVPRNCAPPLMVTNEPAEESDDTTTGPASQSSTPPDAPGPGGDLTISLTRQHFWPGETVTVYIENFTPNHPVTLQVIDYYARVWRGDSISADSNGYLKYDYTLPANFPPGTALIKVVDLSLPAFNSQTSFIVDGPTWTATVSPTVFAALTVEPTATSVTATPTQEPTPTEEPTESPEPPLQPSPDAPYPSALTAEPTGPALATIEP